MAPTVALNSTTILNRLGETAVLSAFLSDRHFVTIIPGGELIRHTAVITKFLVEFTSKSGPEATFFGLDESLELPVGSVIVIRVDEIEHLAIDVYISDAGAPPHKPSRTVPLKPIGHPDKKIDTSLAQTHAESSAILEKVFKIINDPSGNQFPGAALKALINGPGKSLGDTSPAQPDKFDQLVAMLTGGSSSPSAQVSGGTMPNPPAILVKPVDGSPDDVSQKYQGSTSLQAVSALFEKMLRVQKMAKEGRSTPYSITDPKQACLAIQENADLAYQVAIGGLAGYYITTAQTSSSYSKDVSSADFKLEFTSDMFKPFDLATDALTEISGVLQQYISDIASIKIDSSSTNKQISHYMRTTMVSKRNVSGDDDNPIWVWQPETKLVYMHIDTQAYFNATSSCLGHSEVETFHYDMEYTVYEADIDIDQVEANQAMLDKTFNSLTQMNMNDFAQKPGISTEVSPDGDDN
ncbi:hypothetical protein IFR05_010499 [Cadophora sp. M221]|nr:hypothetical protein IFR05_010499 [Cadophora sp. M221]